MPLRKPLHRRPPTRIHRRPLMGQLVLSLRPKERLAARRRRKKIYIGIGAILCVTLSVAGIGFLSYNDRVTIASVEVAGARDIPAREIAAAFEAVLYDGAYHLFSRQNIFLYPRSDIQAALTRDFPRIANISIARESLLSQAVRVSIAERVPRYTWCLPPGSAQAAEALPSGASGDCFVMDGEGFIFAGANGISTTYTFDGGLSPDTNPIGQTFLRGRLQTVVELFKDLESANVRPTEASVLNDKDMIVHLREGYVLKIAFETDPHEVAKNLELILSSDALKGKTGDLEYIDLRFGDRVYYRLR